MPDTYTTEQVILLTGLDRGGVYTLDNRLGWSKGIEKPSHKHKLYSVEKVTRYLQAQAITAQAQRLYNYGKHGRLLWAVTTCPQCKRPAGYFKNSILCIEGHTTEG